MNDAVLVISEYLNARDLLNLYESTSEFNKINLERHVKVFHFAGIKELQLLPEFLKIFPRTTTVNGVYYGKGDLSDVIDAIEDSDLTHVIIKTQLRHSPGFDYEISYLPENIEVFDWPGITVNTADFNYPNLKHFVAWGLVTERIDNKPLDLFKVDMLDVYDSETGVHNNDFNEYKTIVKYHFKRPPYDFYTNTKQINIIGDGVTYLRDGDKIVKYDWSNYVTESRIIPSMFTTDNQSWMLSIRPNFDKAILNDPRIKTIKTLDVLSSAKKNVSEDIIEECINKLPNLENLILHKVSYSKQLPPKITDLTLTKVDINFKHLPTRLKSLKIYDRRLSKDECELLPESLLQINTDFVDEAALLSLPTDILSIISPNIKTGVKTIQSRYPKLEDLYDRARNKSLI